MKLRDYQADLVARTSQAFADARSVVMHLPTGGGKTATASEVIRRALARGRRVVFAAHLDSLISDTHARLAAAGIDAGFVQAGRPSRPDAPVQVCSLGTLHARGEAPPADLVILDECHRALATSVRGVLERYPRAYLLGLTATPQRGDGQPLGDVFEKLVSGPTVKELTAAGYLVPSEVYAPAKVVEGVEADAFAAYVRHAPGSRAIVFASTLEHARREVDAFEAAGYPAAVLSGETPRDERERLRELVTRGELRALVGVRVFVEGFDLPAIETVVLAAAFGVTGSYLQAIGRGLRPSPVTGKTKCVVLDLKGAALLHGLPDDDRVWSIDGKPRRVEKAPAVRKCFACLAMFAPASRCPRCGVSLTVANSETIKVKTSRAEKLERLNDLPQSERDRRYLSQLFHVATVRMRLPPAGARKWAQSSFEKRFGRSPEVTL
jgi:superfamily II DNA or RNA helicase